MHGTLYSAKAVIRPSRKKLATDAAGGSRRSLVGIGDLRLLGPSNAQNVIESLAAELAQDREDAKKGSAGIRSVDPGHALIQLSICYPEQADWMPIVDLLRGPSFSEHLVPSLRLLETASDRLGRVREELLGPLRNLRDNPPPEVSFFNNNPDVSELAWRAGFALKPSMSDTDLLSAIEMGKAGKQAVARRIGVSGTPDKHFQAIASLVHHEDPDITAPASWAVGRWIARGLSSTSVEKLAASALKSGGTSNAIALVSGLDDDGLAIAPKSIVENLRTHESAYVRKRASAID